MKYFTILFFSIATALFSADSQVDLRLDTDPSNLQGKSAFNVITTTALQTEDSKHAVLFTPEMSFYANGGIDFSVTTTHRHKYKNVVVGHNIFFDRTNAGSFFLDQLGTGFDLLTPRFDFRVNYYHPITNYAYSPLKACKWADSEIFFKTPYFGVGTGPLYNLDMKEWALHSRVIIPFKDFSLNFGGLCGQAGFSQAIFSISFHLFKPKSQDILISPPCHVQKANIYYNSGYMFDPMMESKLEYNPNIVTYIEQSEDEITLRDKDGN